jgi:peptidyl-prolyl cis-trans isomerase B (cyclophilin B)
VHAPRPALLAPALAVGLLLSACGAEEDQSQPEAAVDSPAAGEQSSPAGAVAGDCTYTPSAQPASRPVEPPTEDDVVTEGTADATMVTSAGEIPLVLDAANAPCTVASFTSLARQDFFADTACHRLTSQGIFVLQCGDPTGTGTGGPGYEFANENTEGATYSRGTLAMANAGPGTNGSQFFLVYDESPLPPDYSVFGTVTEEGLAVLDQVAAAGAEGGAPDGPPASPVEISDVTVS